LQVRLPSFYPREEAPPFPASPPGPAWGPRDGGDERSIRRAQGAGINF